MHLADALVSPPVAIAAGVVSATLIAVASKKIQHNGRPELAPMMGVLGAFIFVAQMINFAIPGTGSSGHIIGGILLAAILGHWAAFITLASVLIIQCLAFADGGLMALGCNILNMAVISTLVAYPLIYRPIAGNSTSNIRVMIAAIVASIVGLELGAVLVTLETELSGITALPTSRFMMLMLPIHLVIGLCEGVATGLVLIFVKNYRPEMLTPPRLSDEDISGSKQRRMSPKTRNVLIAFGIAALALAISFTWLASGNPDGLEWSIAKLTGHTELAEAVIPSTAVMPDYDSNWSGIVGGGIVALTVWAICAILFRHRRNSRA